MMDYEQLRKEFLKAIETNTKINIPEEIKNIINKELPESPFGARCPICNSRLTINNDFKTDTINPVAVCKFCDKYFKFICDNLDKSNIKTSK